MLPLIAAESTGAGGAITLLFPLLLIVAFFMIAVRPQRQRQRQLQQVQAALAPGVEVMTTSGLFGTVTAVDDETVTLEVAPRVRVRVLRAAIARTVVDAPGSGVPPRDRPPA